MQFASQDQLVRQKISLAVASAGGVLLLFALLTRQRAALAKLPSTIAAIEAQRRFKEYFERHPVAMLIFDVNSLEILTANTAAQRQYGRELRATSIDQIRPTEDIQDFRRDLQHYIACGNTGRIGRRASSQTRRRHRRRAVRSGAAAVRGRVVHRTGGSVGRPAQECRR
jgi:hypothetical protein